MLTLELFEKWTEKYKKSIDCSHPKGFSQKAHCAGRKKHNESIEHDEPLFIQALRDFLPVAMKVLNLKKVPKIVLKKELHNTNVPTFGRFTNEDKVVYCVINNRHPNDILRTLAHELAHYGQGEEHELSSGSWHTGSPVENDAHVKAGIIMRHFNTEYPKYLKAAPIVLPDGEVKESKRSVNEQTEVKIPYDPKEFPIDKQGAPDLADDDAYDPHAQLDHEDYATPVDELAVEFQSALPGAFSVEDLNSDFYAVYRLGLALAAGEEHQAQADNIGKHPFIIPYTDAGVDKLEQAVKHQGYKIKERTTPGSVEISTINKVSPVAAPKKNKYGV
jgi:hypothetical protein